jgi:hypothetical protein
MFLIHFNVYCFHFTEINVCRTEFRNQQKGKDGIITYFLGKISLVDTGTDQMAG